MAPFLEHDAQASSASGSRRSKESSCSLGTLDPLNDLNSQQRELEQINTELGFFCRTQSAKTSAKCPTRADTRFGKKFGCSIILVAARATSKGQVDRSSRRDFVAT